jgi:hypothetical protein
VEAVLLWSRSIRGLTARSRADAPKSGASLNANVEAVGKPQNFAFSRQKVLGFQGSIFFKRAFFYSLVRPHNQPRVHYGEKGEA